jgi:putative nucleotidyltransferase with HDIG domain
MTDRPWAAVILAAGLASRMGRLKPILPLGETTVLERVIRLHQEAGAAHVIVVLGWQAERLQPLVERRQARPVVNARFREGMFTSVAAGLKALPRETTSFFVHPTDIPLVRPFTLRRLTAAGRRRPESVIHPCFCGRRGHPPLVPGRLIETIAADGGEGGLKAVLGRIGAEVCEVEVADEHVLFDVDQPQDYATLQSRWRHYDLPTDLECQALLTRVYPAPAGLRDHALAVARLAEALAEALNRAGCELDVGLVRAAALLHDLAKGRRRHDRVGARWLARMGYGRAAAIVAAHIDLSLDEGEPIGEAHAVFLADKTMQGNQRVSVKERFEAGLKKYGRDPAARMAIQRRLENALAVQKRVEAALGRCIEEIVP